MSKNPFYNYSTSSIFILLYISAINEAQSLSFISYEADHRKRSYKNLSVKFFIFI